LSARRGALAEVAEAVGATPAQVALAWLLRRSPVMVPIPGTSKVAHLEENCAASTVVLSDGQFDMLSRAGA
jgi:aryl-alcohol dehydrogenase-like predicted oxidoreductase